MSFPPRSALTTAAAMAEPPWRPRRAMKGMPRGLAISCSLLSAAPTKPTGKPTMAGGLGRAGIDDVEKMEQGGGGIANDHNRTCQMRPPEFNGSSGAGVGHFGRPRSLVRGSFSVQMIRSRSGRSLYDDAMAHHFGIDEHIAAGKQRPFGSRHKVRRDHQILDDLGHAAGVDHAAWQRLGHWQESSERSASASMVSKERA